MSEMEPLRPSEGIRASHFVMRRAWATARTCCVNVEVSRSRIMDLKDQVIEGSQRDIGHPIAEGDALDEGDVLDEGIAEVVEGITSTRSG
mmetsp:Transcript_103214/g.268812  ORF Transcript_103214/g.268812 Transcript_103214/m.268812 type:complete len:90 (+) Transcript_103214:16-285(+)